MKSNLCQRYHIISILVFCFAIKAEAQCPDSSLWPRKVGILVAMEKEYNLLKDYFTSDSVVVMRCGIGKVNAAIGCEEMARKYQPDVIISMGCAGGNSKGIHIGDVIASKDVAYHDVYCGEKLAYGQMQGMPKRFVADSVLLKKALQLDSKVVPGLIVTGDWFVDSKDKMSEIVSHFPDTKAVDMESAAIAQVCYLHHIPFISFRIVSDIPLEDEHASQYYHFWETASKETFLIAKQFVKSLMDNNIND